MGAPRLIPFLTLFLVNPSPKFRVFTTSLLSIDIPNHWREAMQEPHWKAAMHKEMHALMKNKTLELVPRLAGKHAVGCKWVYCEAYTQREVGSVQSPSTGKRIDSNIWGGL